MQIKNSNFNKKNLFDAFFVFFSRLLQPLSFLILTPFFLKTLGVKIFAIWILIFSIASFSRIGTTGTYSAFVYFISKTDDYDLKKKYALNISAFSLIIIFSIFLLSSIFILLISDISLIKNNQDYKLAFELTLYAICFVLINIYQENTYSILNGLNNFFVPTILMFFSKSLILIAQIVFLLLGYNLKEILILSLIIIFLNSIFEIIFVNYFYLNFLNNFFKNFNFALLKNIYNYSKYLALGSFINTINVNIDKILVTFIFGLNNLTYYAISLSIFLFIHTAYISLLHWSKPKISGSKDLNLKKFFIQLNILLLILGTIGLSVFKFISPSLIHLWLGEDFNILIIKYLNLFLIINFINLFSIPIMNYFISLGFTKEVLTFDLLNLFFLIILMLFLGYFFKIDGLILARCAIIIPLFYGMYKLYFILNKKSYAK